MDEIIEASRDASLSLKRPTKLPKGLHWLIAYAAKILATLIGKPADLTRSQVNLFYRVKQNYSHETLNFLS